MRIGDLIECHNGNRGIVIETEDLYPGHPCSPVGRVRVCWQASTPNWWRPGLFFGVTAIRKASK